MRRRSRLSSPVTARTRNRFMRKMHRNLFFRTSRMWLIMLPRMRWAPIIAAVTGELDELSRVAEDQDPIGFGLVMRNHIFMSRRRLLEADGGRADPPAAGRHGPGRRE
jgi:DNA-binding GntR family transcriptional regulator